MIWTGAGKTPTAGKTHSRCQRKQESQQQRKARIGSLRTKRLANQRILNRLVTADPSIKLFTDLFRWADFGQEPAESKQKRKRRHKAHPQRDGRSRSTEQQTAARCGPSHISLAVAEGIQTLQFTTISMAPSPGQALRDRQPEIRTNNSQNIDKPI